MLGKKGDASSIILFLIIIFFLAVSFMVVLFTNDILFNVVQTTVLNDSSASISILSAFNTVNTVTVQGGFTLMFAILVIGMLLSSFLVRVHPIFIFLYIFTLGISIFLAVFLTNIYQSLIESSSFVGINASGGTMITYIMQHPIVILVGVWALSMLVLFGKVLIGNSSSGGDI